MLDVSHHHQLATIVFKLPGHEFKVVSWAGQERKKGMFVVDFKENQGWANQFCQASHL